MKRRWVYVVGYALALGVSIGAIFMINAILTTDRRLVDGSLESWTEKPFYDVPDPMPEGRPGQLIRSERLASVPDGMIGWRVLYHSTDLNGKDIVVSGLVVSPDDGATGAVRRIVAWGHPTTGIAQRCAPSAGIDPFDSIEGLRDLVGAGYVVAATDYAGMGVAGPASFLIGKAEGQNVLDAARAAQQLQAAHAGNEVVFWGHSQGGHASLFAEQLASSYAPELQVKGVAVAAPATDLAQLLEADAGDVSGITIGSYAMNAYAEAYDLELDTILTPAGVAATPDMAKLCLIGQHSKLHDIATPLIGKYFLQSPSSEQPWSGILTRNSVGTAKVKVPLFVAQGQSDTLVRPAITQQFVTRQQQLGASVTYLPIADTGHGMVAVRALPSLLEWLHSL